MMPRSSYRAYNRSLVRRCRSPPWRRRLRSHPAPARERRRLRGARRVDTLQRAC